MENKWSVQLDGSDYEIQFCIKPESKQQILFINDSRQILPPTSFSQPDIDYSFKIGEHTLNLVTLGNNSDFAVDGVFHTSGKLYRKRNINSWSIVFSIVYVAIFMAILIIPLVLHHAISIWIVLAVPLTLAAIYTALRSGKASFLPVKKAIIKPIIYVVLLFIYLIILLMY